jgi:uncharacterized protein involved in type VI secretion and phage assembly
VPGYAAMPEVSVDGQKLPDEVARDLEAVTVVDHLFLPDTFVLRFRDPKRDALSRARLKIGAKVVVRATSLDEQRAEPLFTGEVTALEAEYDTTGSHTVVRGYDQSHRLHRGRRTASYTKVTASDLAKKVAGRAGLKLGQVDSTSTVYEHVCQGNETDWEFLRRIADAVGYDVTVLDGELHFRAPPKSSQAPGPGGLDSQDRLQLVLGADLEAFRPRVSSAEQVKQVEVRSWDAKRKRALVATAPADTKAASLSTTPAQLAGQFGGPTYVSVDVPFETQAECEAAAKSIAEQIASAFAEAEAVARGNPRLRAGVSVSVGLAGDEFSGRYTITSSAHSFDPHEGYKSHLAFSGRQERSLLGLASLGAASSARKPVYGLVVGVVTNVKDPETLGRVKLKFPWLADDYESDWARVAAAGAGQGRGWVSLPEVDDEVLVAFEHGDVRRPYVIGGLYNAVDKPKDGGKLVHSGQGKIDVRKFVSRLGHMLRFSDEQSGGGILIQTKDAKQELELDAAGAKIRVKSSGEIVIEADGKITVAASSDLALESRTSLSLKAPQVSLSGDSKVEVKAGGQLDLKSNGQTSLEGTATKVKGSATADLEGGAAVKVQGAIVRIN